LLWKTKEGKPQGELINVQIKDVGESKSQAVMVWIKYDCINTKVC